MVSRHADDMRTEPSIQHRDDLAIRDVADLTGLTAGTIRMWEQRHGYPDPARTQTGHRRYRGQDVAVLRRALAYRDRGLSVAQAIERALGDSEGGPRPSLYAMVAEAHPGVRPQVLRTSSLVAVSRAIEHEVIAHGAQPVVFGAFQRERFYRAVEPLYRRIAGLADVATVFADFAAVARPEGGPVEIPIAREEPLGNEWAVIVDAPGYAACLLAWERPAIAALNDAERQFEAIWTLDPTTVRRAATIAARLVAERDAAQGAACEAALHDRPLAVEQPAPAMTALGNRVVAYLDHGPDG